MTKPDSFSSYNDYLRVTESRGGSEARIMSQAIGGDFEAMGRMEMDLLIHAGLTPGSVVVDVGCGSGRLAVPLSAYLTGLYVGTDVVPDLLRYAETLCSRPDWQFHTVSDLVIPVEDDSADFVCFFSVLTHLLHEESFVYLSEAKRVLKPGGRVVFSFLDFSVPSHWAVFLSTLDGMGTETPLNQFISVDAISAWANHLDLEIQTLLRGDEANIPLSESVEFENGLKFTGFGALGQSTAILSKAQRADS